MSLEYNSKAIEEQQREPEFNHPHDGSSSSQESYSVDKPQNKKRHLGCLIPLLIIVLLASVAAIKNPTQTESRQQVKDFIVEKATDVINQEFKDEKDEKDEKDTFISGFERFLVNIFIPHIIEAKVQIHTTDYILFTTFEAHVEQGKKIKNLLSGVIVFGKIIPLQTDLDINKLKNDDKNSESEFNAQIGTRREDGT